MPTASPSAERWRAVFDEFRRGGLTQVEFCRQRGLSIHTFRKHLYDSRVRTDTAAPKFLPIAVPTVAAHDPLVLVLDQGRRIAVAPGFDPRTLARLIETIENLK